MKFPDDENRHKLNRKVDGTELVKPIELPKKNEKAKGKKGPIRYFPNKVIG